MSVRWQVGVKLRVAGSVRRALREMIGSPTSGVTAAIRTQDVASVDLAGPIWWTFYSTVPEAVGAILWELE